MRKKYGEDVSENIMHSELKRELPSGIFTKGELGNHKWEFVPYHIMPKKCLDTEYMEWLNCTLRHFVSSGLRAPFLDSYEIAGSVAIEKNCVLVCSA